MGHLTKLSGKACKQVGPRLTSRGERKRRGREGFFIARERERSPAEIVAPKLLKSHDVLRSALKVSSNLQV